MSAPPTCRVIKLMQEMRGPREASRPKMPDRKHEKFPLTCLVADMNLELGTVDITMWNARNVRSSIASLGIQPLAPELSAASN